MPDPFVNLPDAPNLPARRLLAITPSDTDDLVNIPRGLLVTADGTITLTAQDDDPTLGGVLLGPLTAGTHLPIRPRRIFATGTTATVVGLL